jgi:acyl carrier protein
MNVVECAGRQGAHPLFFRTWPAGHDAALGGWLCDTPASSPFLTRYARQHRHFMSREQVLEVVMRHLVDTIEDLDGVEIDPSKSMKELGANSLDIVEVVSCSMRELKIKIPRAELNNLANLDQLIDLLHTTSQAKSSAAAEA